MQYPKTPAASILGAEVIIVDCIERMYVYVWYVCMYVCMYVESTYTSLLFKKQCILEMSCITLQAIHSIQRDLDKNACSHEPAR